MAIGNENEMASLAIVASKPNPLLAFLGCSVYSCYCAAAISHQNHE